MYLAGPRNPNESPVGRSTYIGVRLSVGHHAGSLVIDNLSWIENKEDLYAQGVKANVLFFRRREGAEAA